MEWQWSWIFHNFQDVISFVNRSQITFTDIHKYYLSGRSCLWSDGGCNACERTFKSQTRLECRSWSKTVFRTWFTPLLIGPVTFQKGKNVLTGKFWHWPILVQCGPPRQLLRWQIPWSKPLWLCSPMMKDQIGESPAESQKGVVPIMMFWWEPEGHYCCVQW